MTTKAELEQELARLRRELSDLKAERAAAGAQGTDDASETDAGPTDVRRLLSEVGLDAESAEDFGARQLDELATLQKEKPLVVLLGAFALGVLLGRAMR